MGVIISGQLFYEAIVWMTIIQRLIIWEAIAGETIFFCGAGWGGDYPGGNYTGGKCRGDNCPGEGQLSEGIALFPKLIFMISDLKFYK